MGRSVSSEVIVVRSETVSDGFLGVSGSAALPAALCVCVVFLGAGVSSAGGLYAR